LYNDAVKRRFLDDYGNNRTNHRIMAALAPFEERLQKDFSQMNAFEAQEVFDSISGIRTKSAEGVLVTLKAYVSWCKANGFPASDAIRDITIGSVEKFRYHMVGSPEHLRVCLNEVFPDPEENPIQYIYRSAMWLSFIGFTSSESARLRTSHIDLAAMEINADDIIPNSDAYKIYQEARRDLEKACTLTVLKEPHGKYDAMRDRAPGDLVLRGKVSDKSVDSFLATTISQSISRAFGKAEEKYAQRGVPVPRYLSLGLSLKRAFFSGVFYRAYETERIFGYPNLEAAVEAEIARGLAEGLYTLGEHYTIAKIRSARMKSYADDYELWKLTFNP